MTEQEFRRNAQAAEQFKRLSETPDTYFWEGYIRGLRRHYHGEKFGTPGEHEQWLGLQHETSCSDLRLRGRGYQTGFDGVAIASALKKVAAISLGSSTSEKKTEAARENGKKGGRPRKTPTPG